MNPQKALKDINPESWYRLSDIVKQKWVVNMVGKPSRRFLYRLIEMNKLPARDFGLSKKQPLWMVRGSDIVIFIKRTYL